MIWKKEEPVVVPLKDHTLADLYVDDDIFATIDGKACIKQYLLTPDPVLKGKIHQWFLLQGIDESDVVEFEMDEIHFLAKLMEFEGPISYDRGIRGYIIRYGVNELEFSLRIKHYGVFFRHYAECPDACGPKAYIVNIDLSDKAKEFLEAQLG